MLRTIQKSTRTARTGMLLGLMAYAVFAPGSALSDEDPDLLARSFACERVQQATVLKDSVCDQSGLLCESTSEGCERLCQNSSRACSSLGRSAAVALSRQIAFEHRGLSRLCRAESDAAACRALLRSSKKSLRQESRRYAKALAENCASEGYQQACYATCRDGSVPLPDCSLDALEAQGTWVNNQAEQPVQGTWIINQPEQPGFSVAGSVSHGVERPSLPSSPSSLSTTRPESPQ